MAEEFKRLERRLVYKGSIIDYYRDTIAVPNGNVVEWDFIGHNGAAAVVPVTDDGKLLLVRQYRNALDRYTLEIPAGGLNKGEPTKEAAARELEEETGIQGLPLVQMATWGAFDRDPRWRVITTSYLALVEGDIPVQAGDDAADAPAAERPAFRANTGFFLEILVASFLKFAGF